MGGCKSSISNNWLLLPKMQAPLGQAPRWGIHWGWCTTKSEAESYLNLLASAVLLADQGELQRLQGLGRTSLQPLIGQSPSKAPVLGSALSHSKVGQIKGLCAEVGFLGNLSFNHQLSLWQWQQSPTWQDSHSQDSWSGHQSSSSKGQEAAWGPCGPWPPVGTEESREAPGSLN